MKKLLTYFAVLAGLLLAPSVGLSFPSATNTASFSTPTHYTWKDFNWSWAGSHTRALDVEFQNTGYEVVIFQMSRPRGGNPYLTVYTEQLEAKTNGYTGLFVEIPRTNIPPQNTYYAEFIGADSEEVVIDGETNTMYTHTTLLASGMINTEWSTFEFNPRASYNPTIIAMYVTGSPTVVAVEQDPAFIQWLGTNSLISLLSGKDNVATNDQWASDIAGLATNDQWAADIANMATNDQWAGDVATAISTLATVSALSSSGAAHNARIDALPTFASLTSSGAAHNARMDTLATIAALSSSGSAHNARMDTLATIASLSSSGAAHNARMDSITSAAASVYATVSALAATSNTLYGIATNKASASYLDNLPAMFLPAGSASFANSGRGHNATVHRTDIFGTNWQHALFGLYMNYGAANPTNTGIPGLQLWQYSTLTTNWTTGAQSPRIGAGLHDADDSDLQFQFYGESITSNRHRFVLETRGISGLGRRLTIDDSGNLIVSGTVQAVSYSGDGSGLSGLITNGQWNDSVAGASNLAWSIGAGATNIANAVGLVASNLHVQQGVIASNAQVTASNALPLAGGSLSGALNLGSNKLTGVQSIRFASNDTYMAVNDELSITTSNGYPMWFNPGGDYRRFVMANQIGEYLVTNVQHWSLLTATSIVSMSATGTTASMVAEHPVTASGYPAGTYPSKATRFDSRYGGVVAYGWMGSFPFNSGSDGRNSMPVWYTSDAGTTTPETTNIFYGAWNLSPSDFLQYAEFVAQLPVAGTVTQNQIGTIGHRYYNSTNMMTALGGTNWFRSVGVLNPW